MYESETGKMFTRKVQGICGMYIDTMLHACCQLNVYVSKGAHSTEEDGK